MKRQKKDWKKEAARDIIALGSIPFYFIVIIRALIVSYKPFLYQLIIAAFFLFLLSLFVKKSDFYVSRSLILLTFTNIFYQEIEYLIFSSLLWLGLLISSNYLNRGKKKEIVIGLFLGISSVAVAYLVSSIFSF